MDINNHTYTSIYIDKGLQQEAKARARTEGVSFSKLVEAAIQLYIKELKAGR